MSKYFPLNLNFWEIATNLWSRWTLLGLYRYQVLDYENKWTVEAQNKNVRVLWNKGKDKALVAYLTLSISWLAQSISKLALNILRSKYLR